VVGGGGGGVMWQQGQGWGGVPEKEAEANEVLTRWGGGEGGAGGGTVWKEPPGGTRI
jgi:hypothetical protein